MKEIIVRLRVEPETKIRWDEYTDSIGMTLSEYIRNAVESAIEIDSARHEVAESNKEERRQIEEEHESYFK